MKSERRHELKTNELAQWIADLPEFWHKNAKLMIYLAVVAVLAILAGYFKWYQRRGQAQKQRLAVTQLVSGMLPGKLQAANAAAQGTDASEALLRTALGLSDLAQQSEDATLTCIALIKQAEALRSELHYRAVSLQPDAARQQIGRAENCYKRALENAGQNKTLTAMAKFGLGLCAEELNETDRAKQIYQQIVDEPDFAPTVFVPAAQERLRNIDQYSKAVTLAEAPAEPEPATIVEPKLQGPLITPAEQDINPPAAPEAPADNPNNG